MYEFQHTQLSLLREAISRRGQCTDALVSNTSSVAYTCGMRPIWSALVLRVLLWTKIHHACGHSESLNMAGAASELGLHAWPCYRSRSCSWKHRELFTGEDAGRP